MASEKQGQITTLQKAGSYMIKPEDVTPKLDTSQWPLLLKNYDKLLVRTSHFTPIPMGCSPLKRDIQSYVRYALTSFVLIARTIFLLHLPIECNVMKLITTLINSSELERTLSM
jgi:hypothetical protein